MIVRSCYAHNGGKSEGSVFNPVACLVPKVLPEIIQPQRTPAAMHVRSWLLFSLVMWLRGSALKEIARDRQFSRRRRDF